MLPTWLQVWMFLVVYVYVLETCSMIRLELFLQYIWFWKFQPYPWFAHIPTWWIYGLLPTFSWCSWSIYTVYIHHTLILWNTLLSHLSFVWTDKRFTRSRHPDHRQMWRILAAGPTQSGNNKKKERPPGLTAMIFDMDMVGHTDDSVSIQSRQQVSCRSSCGEI